jgi:hypothetical protein
MARLKYAEQAVLVLSYLFLANIEDTIPKIAGAGTSVESGTLQGPNGHLNGVPQITQGADEISAFLARLFRTARLAESLARDAECRRTQVPIFPRSPAGIRGMTLKVLPRSPGATARKNAIVVYRPQDVGSSAKVPFTPPITGVPEQSGYVTDSLGSIWVPRAPAHHFASFP